MDIDNEESFTKKCIKCEEPVLDHLDVVYNSLNSKHFLWNKYQIFVYEDAHLECIEKIFIPGFLIHLVIVSNNYLLCLDCEGNIHLTSLKFKSASQRSLKLPFQSRSQGNKTFVRYREDYSLSLKYEADAYFLCLHKINTDFQLEKKIILLCNDEHWPLEQTSMNNYLLTTHSVIKENFQQLSMIFKLEESRNNCEDLILISFDRLTIYGCMLSPDWSGGELSLVKMYNSPAEICNLEIVDSGQLFLVIGLKMGTIIRIHLNDTSKTPYIAYLNTSLYKMLVLKNFLIYSDGKTMWKAEDIFSNSPKFTQFFLKNVKSFIKCGDQIICTTFSKLIYKFSIDDQNAYLIPKTNDDYCSAEKLLNNSTYLNKLFEEIDKNNELVKKLQKEQDYITVLSLSRRQDVVNKAIESSITVFECYYHEEILAKENITLTEHITEYLTSNTWLLLVSVINLRVYDTLNSILSHLSESVQIFITLSSAYQLLKTTCTKLADTLSTVNYLIPLNISNIPTEINVNIKLIINMPGAIDQKKSQSVLYRKDIVLTSEHFIKTGHRSTRKSLKNETESTEELTKKINRLHYGSLFEFTDINKLETMQKDWSFYVKLPNDYKQIFRTDRDCKSCINTEKLNSIMQQLSAEEFLKSKKHLIFSIGTEKLAIKVQNDGFSNPLLKISSSNAKVALNIRNFLANIIYNDYKDCEAGKDFISYAFYTTTEVFNLFPSIVHVLNLC